MEPNIIFFSDAGPDIRWCGNERGYTGETNWATIDTDSIYAGKSGIGKLLNSGQENGKNYIPSEVDVSIRPGWFYHAAVKSDSYRGNSKLYAASNITDGKKETYWTTNDDVTTGNLVIDLGSKKTVKFISLQEYIKLGQRVKSFEVSVWKNNVWEEVIKATTIGYKRILRIEPTETEKIKISITSSKAAPLISNVAIY